MQCPHSIFIADAVRTEEGLKPSAFKFVEAFSDVCLILKKKVSI